MLFRAILVVFSQEKTKLATPLDTLRLSHAQAIVTGKVPAAVVVLKAMS